MILVLTTPQSDEFVTVDVPILDYSQLVATVSHVYRKSTRPTTIAGLLFKMKGKRIDRGAAVGFITVEDFKAKIAYPGQPDFTAQTYEGRPSVNIIPRYVPDLPRSVSGFSPTR